MDSPQNQLEPLLLTNNPTFNALVLKLAQIHNVKNHDYAQEENPFSNFEYAAQHAYEEENGSNTWHLLSTKEQLVWFKRVYNVLLGIKKARRLNLESGVEPNNEPLMDTKIDEANYTLLKLAHEIKVLDLTME